MISSSSVMILCKGGGFLALSNVDGCSGGDLFKTYCQTHFGVVIGLINLGFAITLGGTVERS